MQIRLLTLNDLDLAADHLGRHRAEHGTPGDPLFAPFGAGVAFDADDFRRKREERWANAPTALTFERMWGLFLDLENGRSHLVGHVDLHRAGIASERHRVWLGMGLERAARGKGHGRALLDTALTWARAQPTLAWVDLGVFAENEPARALYRRAGFNEIGYIVDRFRIDGHRVDDVQMTLNVEAGTTR